MIKTAQAVFYIIFIFFYVGCSSHPRMVNYYNYDLPKSDVIDLCKTILINLDYEIDILAPESNVIITKSNKIGFLPSYSYEVYIKITDKIEIYLNSNRQALKLFKDFQFHNLRIESMPYSLQQKIFTPIRSQFKRKNIRRIQLN